MITEDYVSFEIAKLLKEKGFDELCPTFYETDEPNNGPKYSKKLGWFLHNSYDYSDRHGKMIISTPTLQMAMKWLREVHHLVVEPYYYFALGEWCVDIKHLEKRTELEEFENIREKSYNTYEEACETAIKYCLENLI